MIPRVGHTEDSLGNVPPLRMNNPPRTAPAAMDETEFVTPDQFGLALTESALFNEMALGRSSPISNTSSSLMVLGDANAGPHFKGAFRSGGHGPEADLVSAFVEAIPFRVKAGHRRVVFLELW